MMTIADNCVVSMRYIMTDSEGAVLENTLAGNPVSHLQGGEFISRRLQQQLHGLQAGDKKKLIITRAETGAGTDFVFEVIIDQVRKALPEEILLGYPVEAPVLPCALDCACYQSVNNPSAL